MAARTRYDRSVFLNCPFDDDYAALFDAIVFTVHDCGFQARCALEVDDSARVRIDRIFDIVQDCRYGIHDISRTELDEEHELPRFNMPFELGVFLGARRFGRGRQREKVALILDRDRFRYQKYLSDVAGQDIKAHDGDVRKAVRVVRDWLRGTGTIEGLRIPSGSRIFQRYEAFLIDLPALCDELDLDPGELIYNDYTTLVANWLREHPR
jgi:hypothetical protein